MKQPICGEVPPELEEVACKVVWPTIGATRAGRLVGQLAAIPWGIAPFTLGNLFALLTIPLSVAVFGWQLMPYVCRRYALTNRRIIIRQGLRPRDVRWIGLDEFDRIDVDVLPGQQWLRAGDLVFRSGGNEVFRLPGIPRPAIFRQVCQTQRDALVEIQPTVEREPVAV
jgi:hypothetical protein